MRSLRPTTLLLTLLAALTLAACTTESQVCNDGVCKLSMSGKGATAKLGGDDGSTIELLSASGTTAKVKIAGQEGTLTLNEPVQLDNATLTLTEVKENTIKARIEISTGSTDSTTPSGDDGSNVTS